MDIVKGTEWSSIYNLAYRGADGEVVHCGKWPAGTLTPNPYSRESLLSSDFSALDLRPYWDNFRRRYPGAIRRPLPIVTRKGCHWRQKAGCIFCSIPNERVVLADPQDVWAYLEKLQAEYDSNFFWEVSDSFTGDPDWLAALLETRPKSLEHVGWYVYSRPDELLVPGVCQNLRELNVTMVYVGFESADSACLRFMRKGTSQKQNRQALALIDEAEFGLNASFILGAPGETSHTVDRTVAFCHEVAERLGSRLQLVNANILIPYPGTEAFRLLCDQRPEFAEQDAPRYAELTNAWVDAFCQLTGDLESRMSLLRQACREMEQCGQFKNRM